MVKGVFVKQSTIISGDDSMRKQFIETKKEAAKNIANKDYSHVFSLKSRFDLLRISCIVLGIEIAYAAETAFVSPILLDLGFYHHEMTMFWGIAPVLGFFISPLIGALSDNCRFKWGRRRPFITILSVGILIGLVFIPYSDEIVLTPGLFRIQGSTTNDTTISVVDDSSLKKNNLLIKVFKILGIILLDFSADNCLTPVRAYLLDITLPEQQPRALSMFTIMAGIGGTLGFVIGGINWNDLAFGKMLGSNENTLFGIVLIVFSVSSIVTLTSFREIPLKLLETNEILQPLSQVGLEKFKNKQTSNGTVAGTHNTQAVEVNPSSNGQAVGQANQIHDDLKPPSLSFYIKNIVCMPPYLWKICLTNFLSWMSHSSYCLYFTDFVGEVIFGGNVTAPENSPEYQLYYEGVRFGCFGMAIYAISCTLYSMIIETLVKKFKAKTVYVGGLLIFAIAMLVLSIYPTKPLVLILSVSGGIIYATIFNIPFLLVSTYHSNNDLCKSSQDRGLGTDIAIVGSMLFVAQFIISLTIGQLIELLNSAIAVVYTASFFAFLSALSALNVLYLDT